MTKRSIREQDPERYAKVKAEQEELKRQCSAQMSLARMCPYCGHKVIIQYRGQHSYFQQKRPHCGEEVVFPPLQFMRAN